MSDLRAIRARDAAWSPECQFILVDEETARIIGCPWPITVEQASGYHRLCRKRQKDPLPHRFAGPQWDHDEFVYNREHDHSVEADRRDLLRGGAIA